MNEETIKIPIPINTLDLSFSVYFKLGSITYHSDDDKWDDSKPDNEPEFSIGK